MMVSKYEVIWAYRIMLGREPESDAVIAGKLNCKNLNELCGAFIDSPEFARKLVLPFIPLDSPANHIEYQVSEEILKIMTEKVKLVWSYLGSEMPYYSVLTQPEFHPDSIHKNIDAFWETVNVEIDVINQLLSRYNIDDLGNKICIEYGCGVGRITLKLAEMFSYVYGYDISHNHLEIARERALETSTRNCFFTDRIDSVFEMCDFFYTKMVLQHNPPPIIHNVLYRLLGSLKPGGIGVFQIPTYIDAYAFSVNEWLVADNEYEMQMHCLSQEVVFSLINEQGCELLCVREDYYTGEPYKIISNMFVVRKQV